MTGRVGTHRTGAGRAGPGLGRAGTRLLPDRQTAERGVPALPGCAADHRPTAIRPAEGSGRGGAVTRSAETGDD